MHYLLNTQFGFADGPNGNPALYLFGYPIYLYALIIVSGMCIAMLIGAYFFKKRGIDPYDMSIYSIFMLPLGILGARLYVYIFPWEGQSADWSTFFDFRSGGLGIYGGVVLGYLAVLAVAWVRKQKFNIIADCIIPGLFLAQCIGRWGNFANQEAYGPIITNPNLQFFPFGVYIDSVQQWHQATFFYESLGTFIGFIVCMILVRKKNYRIGWLTAFYGIYYGIVRLLVEGLRTDSLFLWIGETQTDIKISQLVSVFTILLGFWTLGVIYRQKLHAMYLKWFKNEYDEVSKSRYVLGAIAFVFIAIAIVMFALGGESKFIAGAILVLLSGYSVLGIFALNDRLQLYCKKCGKRNEPVVATYNNVDLLAVKVVYMWVALVVLAFLALYLLGIGIYVTHIANHIVLGIIATIASIVVAIAIHSTNKNIKKAVIKPSISSESQYNNCNCGGESKVKLNKWLLAIFPYKQYADYSVDNLVEWVDPAKTAKENK